MCPLLAGVLAPTLAALWVLVTRFSAVDRLVLLVDAAPQQPLALVGVVSMAAGLGAAHALAPGHGKTLVAAYLVGSRGTAAQALLLGLSVTLTHTAGVFALGVSSLALTRFVAPARWLPAIELLAGGVVALLGVQLARQRLLVPAGGAHAHPHEHGLHAHTHDPIVANVRGWLLLGVAGGLVPCPSALVLLLTAIGLGRAGFGLVLIAAFSLGLASVLTGVGLLFVSGRRALRRLDGHIPTLQSAALRRALPMASAVFVSIVGVGLML